MEGKIVVTYEVEEEAKRLFQESFGDVAHVIYLEGAFEGKRTNILEEADVIISLSFSPTEIAPEEIPRLKKTRLIQLIFAGADNVPFHLIPESIIVASNPGAFAEPIAEHVLAMILCLAKNLHVKHELLARGVFDPSGFSTVLKGGTCGIIGFGGNGKAVARIMRGIGMRVYAINRKGKTDESVDFIGKMGDLRKVLETSDVVVLTVPLTKTTRGLIGHRQLGWMKRDAILINVARGAAIDQKALYEHLKKNRNFRAGIDTWWSEPGHHGKFRLEYPFFQLPNIMGSPHNADHVPGMLLKATRRALGNVRRYLLGQEIRGVVPRDDYID